MGNKLLIVCITYNQGLFIRQALNSFLMQKTNFPFEVIIGDDCSTDSTPRIIKEYSKKYPEIIKPILREENIGATQNFVDTLSRAKTKYLAICEGDDYWTDPLKLQKQVDFLESHPDYSICFHPVEVKWEDGSYPDSIFPNDKTRFYKDTLELSDLLKHNFIQTNSVMYRWRFHKDSLSLIPDNILPGDWFLHLLHAQVGKIGFIPDVMAVYRKHNGGIWYGASEDPMWFCKDYKRKINFFVEVQKQFGVCMENSFYGTVFETYYAAILLNKKEIVDDLENKFSFLSKPKNNEFMIIAKLMILKLKSKIGLKAVMNKENFKALKLYKKWKYSTLLSPKNSL